MRVIQPEGTNGSLKWIQRAIAHRPDLLQPAGLGPIEWRSPLKEDNFAEYRDASFLNRLGLGSLFPALETFWPSRGPQWDALGLHPTGPLLVEAKAHLKEFASTSAAASPKSRQLIAAAFASVQSDLGLASATWTTPYYQYANRLAHLWWLRKKNIDAKLLLVGFIGDAAMGGPAQAEDWRRLFQTADAALGLPSWHALSEHIYHLEPHVSAISTPVG